MEFSIFLNIDSLIFMGLAVVLGRALVVLEISSSDLGI